MDDMLEYFTYFFVTDETEINKLIEFALDELDATPEQMEKLHKLLNE